MFEWEGTDQSRLDCEGKGTGAERQERSFEERLRRRKLLDKYH